MAARLGIVVAGPTRAHDIVRRSRAALDRPLAYLGSPDAAELWIAIASSDAVALGAFGRAAGIPAGRPLLRRGSGGPPVVVAPGTIHVALALSHPAALVPCDERRIVNRHVRPLLRALTRTGALAHFFGRDWISVGHAPVAWVGFGHDATTRRTVFEAFVAVRASFALDVRASFRGHAPATLESVSGRRVDEERLTQAIVAAYRELSDDVVEADAPAAPDTGAEPEEDDLRADPPWAGSKEEAIGIVGAGPDARGVFRIGGDLLASRDALAGLETAVASAPDDAVGPLVDRTLAARGVALDGVRSLTSVRDAILQARASHPLAPRRGPP